MAVVLLPRTRGGGRHGPAANTTPRTFLAIMIHVLWATQLTHLLFSHSECPRCLSFSAETPLSRRVFSFSFCLDPVRNGSTKLELTPAEYLYEEEEDNCARRRFS